MYHDPANCPFYVTSLCPPYLQNFLAHPPAWHFECRLDGDSPRFRLRFIEHLTCSTFRLPATVSGDSGYEEQSRRLHPYEKMKAQEHHGDRKTQLP